jgi:uncharacterized protein YeaO (DUF488 family)
MVQIQIKRVYDAPAAGDGKRILVDRLWPRGLTKEAAALDGWVKEVAPSPELRKWFDHAAERFAEFKDRYEAELAANPAVSELLETLGVGKASLLYAARDPAVNHALVLAGYLQRHRPRARR